MNYEKKYAIGLIILIIVLMNLGHFISQFVSTNSEDTIAITIVVFGILAIVSSGN